MEKITTRTAELSFLEKRIILIKMKEGDEMDIDEVKENVEAAIKMAQGEKYSTLVDYRVSVTMTREAREFLGTYQYDKPYARAIVVNSLPGKLVANFFIKFSKSDFFSKVFNDEQKAIEWLREKRIN